MRAVVKFGPEADLCFGALNELWKQEHARYYEAYPCKLMNGEYAGFFRDPEVKVFGWRRSSGATATVQRVKNTHTLTLEGRRHALVKMPGWHAIGQMFKHPHEVLELQSQAPWLGPWGTATPECGLQYAAGCLAERLGYESIDLIDHQVVLRRGDEVFFTRLLAADLQSARRMCLELYPIGHADPLADMCRFPEVSAEATS